MARPTHETTRRTAAIVEHWLPMYLSQPWINEGARVALVRSEDAWLARFAGLNSLTHDGVNELLDWKWQRYAAKRQRSRRGVASDWGRAHGLIVQALAAVTPEEAIDALRWPTGGIPTWQTSTASVVLAACRPDRFTIADTRALKTVRLIQGAPQPMITSIKQFQRSSWIPYLNLCRDMSHALGIRLRDIDRAFWVSAGRRPPAGF